MSEPTLSEVLEEVAGLRTALEVTTAAFGDLQEEVAKSRRYGRKTRLGLWFDCAATVIAVALGLWVGSISHTADQADQHTNQNTAALVASCRSSNQVRAKDILIWDTAIELIAPPATLNPSSLKSEDGFKAYVAQTFAPRNCRLVASGTSTTNPPKGHLQNDHR